MHFCSLEVSGLALIMRISIPLKVTQGGIFGSNERCDTLVNDHLFLCSALAWRVIGNTSFIDFKK